MDDDSVADLVTEISALKRCKNRNIVGFYGAWKKRETNEIVVIPSFHFVVITRYLVSLDCDGIV